MHEELGGAALVHRLLWKEEEKKEGKAGDTADPAGQAVLLPPGWVSSLTVERIPDDKVATEPPDVTQHAYAFWRPRDETKKAKEGPKKQFWRVTEQMGFGQISKPSVGQVWRQSGHLPDHAEIIVVADGGTGFQTREKSWERLPFNKKGTKWIVLKTEAPDFGNGFWGTVKAHREKLIVVIAAHELRHLDARIGCGLSWESTLQDLFRELAENVVLAPLRDSCAHLVVSFGMEAAVWIQFPKSRGRGRSKTTAVPTANFIFDAPAAENERREDVEGGSFGLMSCLAAGVVWSVTEALDTGKPLDLVPGIEGGLSAMRDLLERGHGEDSRDEAFPSGYPGERLAVVIKTPRHFYSRSRFAWDEKVGKDSWSILGVVATNLLDRARLVAEHGDVVLQNVPHLQIGDLFTADRREIESLRILVNTIRRYKDPSERGKKPLSIGVFGPPGSGKSFAVNEIANHFFGKESWLVFNLSQFKEEDLIGALHQVRDRALKGLIPVAFFDEFDSQNLRWLQYLLAPMQDGVFQEGQITHPIGKCVFVFAGGTSHTYGTFTPAPHPPKFEETEFQKAFRLAKGPDFASRLDATLDVLGPNARSKPLKREPKKFVKFHHIRVGTYVFEPDDTDYYKVIRRARLIRHELGVKAGARLEIEPHLLTALLKAPRYEHGSRSIGKILQILKPAARDAVRPALMPPMAQLELHTPAQAFVDLMLEKVEPWPVQKLGQDQIDIVAREIHEVYRALGKRAGWMKKENPMNVEFSTLPEIKNLSVPLSDDDILAWKKESNRKAAQRISKLLALAGLKLETSRKVSAKEMLAVLIRLESLLELLARTEHKLWMDWHYEHEWKFGKKRDEKNKIHDQLLPYGQLDATNKNKDRSAVRHLSEFVHRTGWSLSVRPPRE